MTVRAPEQEEEVVVRWADRAESASVACGTAAAVLAMGLAVTIGWYVLLGLSLTVDGGPALAAGIDVVLLLLSVTFHLLAEDLGGR